MRKTNEVAESESEAEPCRNDGERIESTDSKARRYDQPFQGSEDSRERPKRGARIPESDDKMMIYINMRKGLSYRRAE